MEVPRGCGDIFILEFSECFECEGGGGVSEFVRGQEVRGGLSGGGGGQCGGGGSEEGEEGDEGDDEGDDEGSAFLSVFRF